MLIGQYKCRIDHKNHLMLPAAFLGLLAPGAVVTYGLDHNLLLFPLTHWDNLAKRIHRLPLSKTNSRSFQRFIFSGAVFLTPDRKGQITLLPQHKKFASIDREVNIVGLYNYVEIWGASAWKKVQDQFSDPGLNRAMHWDMLGV